MATNATAPKLEQKTALKIVKSQDEKEVKATAKKATTEKATTEKAIVKKATAEKATEVKATARLTINEIKRKNEILTRLTERHDRLSGKLNRLENFAISHDRELATVKVTDSRGEEFKSNSPKTIKKLIEFWKTEFNDAIAELEQEIQMNA